MKHAELSLQQKNCLMKEWGVAELPASFRNKMRQVYAELPDELPCGTSHRRSRGKKVLRVCFTAAGSLAAAFVLLIGVNAVNPTLAESIPGIGQMFQRLNGKNAMGSNIPSYDGAVKALGVTAQTESTDAQNGEGQTSPGVLKIDEYYSDGVYLYLSTRLDEPSEEAKNCVWIGPQFLEEDASEFLVNGKSAEKYSWTTFQREENGEFKGIWVLKLPERITEKQELSVSMAISRLYGVTAYERYTVDCKPDFEAAVDFHAEFTVTADPESNRTFDTTAVDNGTKLLSVDSTPSFVTVQAEVAYFGRESFDLLSNEMPLGVYAELKTAEGVTLERNSENTVINFGSGGVQGVDDGPIFYEEPLVQTWAFNGAPAGTKQVVLTVYAYQLREAASDTPGGNYVLAEFTVDLETGTAAPSENYLQKGMRKITPEEFLSGVHHADFTNGYFVSNAYEQSYAQEGEQAGAYARFYTENMEYRALELRCYKDGALVKTMKSRPEAEFNSSWPGGPSYYEEEDGSTYYEGTTDPAATQKTYKSISFFAAYPGEAPVYDVNSTQRLYDNVSLVDSVTGEVLMEDVEQVLYEENRTTYGF